MYISKMNNLTKLSLNLVLGKYFEEELKTKGFDVDYLNPIE